MFSRHISVFYFVLTAALLVAAMPASGAPAAAGTTVPTVSTEVFATRGDTCSTGPVQCCQTVGSVQDPVFGLLLGLLGIVVNGVDVLLGINCSPLSVIGIGSGNACSSNVVCCENNNVGGLISIGCIPIIL